MMNYILSKEDRFKQKINSKQLKILESKEIPRSMLTIFTSINLTNVMFLNKFFQNQ